MGVVGGGRARVGRRQLVDNGRVLMAKSKHGDAWDTDKWRCEVERFSSLAETR